MNYQDSNNEQLQEYYANCDTTRARANGHGKSEHNRRRVSLINKEMKVRGITPDGRQGAFNGKGSF